jgi:RHS repeat-associated protein
VRTVSGNEAEQTRTVVRTNALETFEYDGNGNLTNWVSGAQNWSYEWDWADRLTKVTSNGVVVLENWFDAQSRRIAKAEVVNGQMVKTLYLYDGWDIVGVMNGAGQMGETFTRGVGLAGDIGTLVAVTHHAGSWTNGTFYAHHNHRGDVILTRSGTTTVGRYDYTAFGALKSQIGIHVSRFTFSSKERDASTGFSYYGYRFYSPQWQRWANRDPIEEEGGLNLYAYVGNDPVNEFDPLGLLAGAPLPAPPPTLPPPIGTPKPGPPIVTICTVAFCVVYTCTAYACEKTGVHDKLGDLIYKCRNRKSALEKCKDDCYDSYLSDVAFCKGLRTKRQREYCYRQAFKLYVDCLKGCEKEHGGR